MSCSRYKWLQYVRWMILLYPERVALLRQLQEAGTTAKYDRIQGGGLSRPTERRAMASLGATCDREVEAVRKAIETTKRQKNGDTVLQLINLEFWQRSHNMTGAAMACYVSESTARRWRMAFIQEVAKNFGLMDYTDEARKVKPSAHASVIL